MINPNPNLNRWGRQKEEARAHTWKGATSIGELGRHRSGGGSLEGGGVDLGTRGGGRAAPVAAERGLVPCARSASGKNAKERARASLEGKGRGSQVISRPRADCVRVFQSDLSCHVG
jgi:hypothetical protein